jgi:hypothetical protein
MGENVEIQPMTTAEIRQYFNKHAKTTDQLALQLNQLMINVSSHRLPQTMQLTGPGMVSKFQQVLVFTTQSINHY